jgi:hypothetical protein
MKKILFSFILLLAIVLLLTNIGCKITPAGKEISYEATVSTASDSIHKVEIQTIVDSLNSQIRADTLSHYKFQHAVLTPQDSLEYWVADGEPVRISLLLKQNQNSFWPTLYLKNDTLIQVRYRQHIKNDTINLASETMIYLKAGKIAFAEERHVHLQSHELPALIRLQPVVISQRTFGELELLYQKYYPSLKQVVDEHFAIYRRK